MTVSADEAKPVQIQSESTGCVANVEEHPHCAEERPVSEEWMSGELIDRTVELWSRVLGRKVRREEAVEALFNIRNLTAFFAVKEEAKQKRKDKA